MSKKLLVSNNRSVSVDVPLPTISDGLVCFLDGRNKGNGNVWTDLSGNNNHAYYSNAKNQRGIIFKDGGMYFQKDGDFGVTVNNAIKGLGKYAVEITFEFTGEFEAGVLGFDVIGLHLKDEINADIGNVLKYIDFYHANFKKKTTVLMTFNDEGYFAVYSNGLYELRTFTKEHVNNCNNVILGCDKTLSEDNHIGNYGKAGLYIYSFKVYNRILTEDEIVKSYEEEQSIVRE